jgi:hypothetical protein
MKLCFSISPYSGGTAAVLEGYRVSRGEYSVLGFSDGEVLALSPQGTKPTDVMTALRRKNSSGESSERSFHLRQLAIWQVAGVQAFMITSLLLVISSA